MNSEDYISKRVEDQILWYDQKSMHAQWWFKKLRFLEIVAAGSIPLFAGFGKGQPWTVFIVGILGAFVAIVAAVLSLYQFQENWIAYRTTCESLKHEKYLFVTKAEPYHEDDAFDLFVQRVEGLISRENSSWSQYTRKGAEASKPQSQS